MHPLPLLIFSTQNTCSRIRLFLFFHFFSLFFALLFDPQHSAMSTRNCCSVWPGTRSKSIYSTATSMLHTTLLGLWIPLFEYGFHYRTHRHGHLCAYKMRTIHTGSIMGMPRDETPQWSSYKENIYFHCIYNIVFLFNSLLAFESITNRWSNTRSIYLYSMHTIIC